MKTKYDNVNLPIEVFDKTIGRLTNQLWKLIPMRENNENWTKQLETIIIELTGIYEILTLNSEEFQLLSKLEGMLNRSSIPFDLYRKTVFESISLLQGMRDYDRER